MEVKAIDNNKEKVKSKKKILLIVLLVILAVLVIAGLIFFVYVARFYQTHFFQNTTINGFDCSNKSVQEVVQMVDSEIRDYKLEVFGRLDETGENGLIGEIGVRDMDLHYVDTKSAVENILEQQNEWYWIEILKGKRYGNSIQQGVDFDEEMLIAYMKEWGAFKNMIEPQDAYISEYSEEIGGYEIIPETIGTAFDEDTAIETIKNAILMQEGKVDLEEIDCYESAKVTADDEKINESVNTINRWLGTSIVYDWNGQEVIVDKELLLEWVSLDGNEPKLDEEAVADFVAKNARAYDTYGKDRKFTTTLGVELTLPSGAFGWKTDRDGETEALIQAIHEGSTLEKEPLYSSKGKRKGKNDIGSSYVEADLTNQHLYLYYQGTLVLETDFVSGDVATGCNTPFGVFGLTYKTMNAVLRGRDYVTPVTYWMPFHGNYGMHDATWRTEFGGDIYLTNGSHGCLNLPLDKAEAIYAHVSKGFPVICYYY